MVDGEGTRGGAHAEARADTSEDPRVVALEEQVADLTRALSAMDQRLRALEGTPKEESPLVSSVRPKSEPPEPELEEEPSVESEPAHEEPALPFELPSFGELLPQAASVGGRLLLILGGGYLLRALTERGTLPQTVGVALALGYAAVWLFVADRQAREKPTASASASGAAFALIAFPLLAEVTARFHLFNATQAAIGLALAAGAGTWVAWRRRLRPLGWVILGATLSATAGTVFETKLPIPYLVVVIALAVALDCVACHRNWRPLRVVTAIAADVTLLGHTTVVLVQREYVLETTLVLLGLFAAYMLAYMLRTRIQKRPLSLFERLQASAVLAVGYIGAVLVARTELGRLTTVLGVTSLIAGTLGYGVAYYLFVMPAKNRVEAWFNTSYALVGLLVGSWLLLHEPGYAFAGIGVVLAILGARDEHAALPLHAAVCAFFAALGSGLLRFSFDAFWQLADVGWPSLEVSALAALAVAVVAYLAPPRSPEARALLPARIGKTLALAVTVAGIGVLLLIATVDPVGGGVGSGADAGRIAALRTGVLAVSALGLAALSRLERFREAGYLVYPVLGIGAFKLIVQDFPNGRALTLFAAFILFGTALLVAPRLRQRPAASAG
jgi:hypothetical protein